MKKYKALFLATTIMLPAVILDIGEVEASTRFSSDQPFSDITKDSPYLNVIRLMAGSGVIRGYEDGTFRPNEAITRKHVSILINRVIDLNKVTEIKQVKIPKDLNKSNIYFEDILKLVQAGLLEVDPSGNVNPNKPVTRGEMSKILAIAFKLEGATHDLNDVSSKYSPYVSALYENNVTTGFEDNTYRENQTLTRGHYATFMYRAMNSSPYFKGTLNISLDSSAEEYNSYISSSGLFSDEVKPINEVQLKNAPYIRKDLLNISDLLLGTNFYVGSFLGAVSFVERGSNKNQYDKTQFYSYEQVFFQITGKDYGSIGINYTNPDAVELGKRVVSKYYSDILDVEMILQIIDMKVAQAVENKNDKRYENWEHFKINGYSVNIGLNQIDNVKKFGLQITIPLE